MYYFALLLVAAIVIAVCFGIDKGFTALFRSKPQHASGLSVRINKRYAAFGAVLSAVGIGGMISTAGKLIVGFLCSGFVLLIGIYLAVYYMTFGIFYDHDSFILTTFGHASKTYHYSSIVKQQLFLTSGSVVIELDLDDGRSISLQSTMEGVYPFLDVAFDGWCREKGITKEDCPFHDPDNSCWFPTEEV